MAHNQPSAESAMEIDRLATQLAKDPQSKSFIPLAEEYGKAGMWQEAASVLEDGLKYYPGFITAMVALGRAYDQLGQPTKAKAVLEESIKLSPDNLRAHRTLMKIYTSQGEQASALQSCAVILRVNPRDEEALSVQASLNGPSSHASGLTTPPASREPQASTVPTQPSPAMPELSKANTQTQSTPSAHAGVIAQLEAWLRTIESRRHTRDTVTTIHAKTSQ